LRQRNPCHRAPTAPTAHRSCRPAGPNLHDTPRAFSSALQQAATGAAAISCSCSKHLDGPPHEQSNSVALYALRTPHDRIGKPAHVAREVVSPRRIDPARLDCHVHGGTGKCTPLPVELALSIPGANLGGSPLTAPSRHCVSSLVSSALLCAAVPLWAELGPPVLPRGHALHDGLIDEISQSPAFPAHVLGPGRVRGVQ
jgi:hypothetical protein